MAKIGLPKGSGKQLKVREKSVKSQGILKRILSGNPVDTRRRARCDLYSILFNLCCSPVFLSKESESNKTSTPFHFNINC